jgi:hypothetical protein
MNLDGAEHRHLHLRPPVRPSCADVGSAAISRIAGPVVGRMDAPRRLRPVSNENIAAAMIASVTTRRRPNCHRHRDHPVRLPVWRRAGNRGGCAGRGAYYALGRPHRAPLARLIRGRRTARPRLNRVVRRSAPMRPTVFSGPRGGESCWPARPRRRWHVPACTIPVRCATSHRGRGRRTAPLGRHSAY